MEGERTGVGEKAAAAERATGIQKIVWIKKMLKRWQSTAARRSKASATQASAGSHHVEVDAADGGTEPSTPGAPVDVPRGCCAVYVGAERRRFVVPTAYLGMPVFRRLLEKAEEEFEFDYAGGAVTIPCDTEAFKYILVVMDRHRKGLVVLDHEGNPTEAIGD